MKLATPFLALLLLVACADEPKKTDEKAGEQPAKEAADTEKTTEKDTTVTAESGETEKTGTATDSKQQFTGPAKIEFDKLKHDFGTHTEGDSVFTYFNFQNTGGADLNIQQVKPSCTCTGVQYTKKTYKAGEKGKIRVSYPTKGKKGFNSKSVMVFTNVDKKPIELKFSLEVE